MSFRGQRILITGGTGSCGQQITHRLLNEKPKEIIILSRDEKKQVDMSYELKNHAEVKFFIGDVRDYERVDELSSGVDVIFHTAAMKYVNFCERNPLEAAKTNINGTGNVIKAALKNKVKKVVYLSTDKAVEPVNVMGMTKAVAEKLVAEANFSPQNKGTTLACIRYGNVMNSRGSVIPFFRSLLQRNKPLTITHPSMTRFLLTINEATELVIYAASNMKGGEVFVRKVPSVKIVELAEVLAQEQKRRFKPEIIGTYPGEKLHELLVSKAERSRAIEKSNYFIIKPARDYSPLKDGDGEYSSKDEVISKKEIPALLKKSDVEYHKGTFKLSTAPGEEAA